MEARPGRRIQLEEAPVFYPTEKEFENPLLFIASIRPRAEKYGLCKIVPPAHWKPQFALDLQEFRFKTKVQAIHQLQQRHAGCDPDTFRLEYTRFREIKGMPPLKWPTFDGGELDMCLLFNAVKRRGGFLKVTREKKWEDVLRMVKPERATALGDAGTSALRQIYDAYLLSYEKHVLIQAAKSKSPQGPKVLKKSSGMERGAIRNLPPSSKNASVDGGIQNHDKEHLHPQRLDSTELTALAPSAKDLASEFDSFSVRNTAAGTQTASLGETYEKENNSGKATEMTHTTEVGDEICVQCKGGNHAEVMLLCDRCNQGWHTFCLTPPLPSIPEGNWYCPNCLNSTESFGFLSGQDYNLATFRSLANKFKRKWFKDKSPSLDEVEEEFWRIVEESVEPVNVYYGSDLDTSIYGSGFPRLSKQCPPHLDPNLWDTYGRSPWNVNNFPKQEGSVLNIVDDNISGVIVPWLYIGMLFSTFCWHYEDHCFYSVNYLHWGEPKCWYSVPGSSSPTFEAVMKQSFPDLFESQPDLLFQLVTMLNPMVLKQQNVPICKAIQKAGEFVITFPRSYHAGFNYGLNCAEAVNFAPPDWLPWGGCSVEHYRLFKKSAVISHEELLCAIAKVQSGNHNSETAKWLRLELQRVFAFEEKYRIELWREGVRMSERMTAKSNPSRISFEEDPECMICHYYLHLSCVTCPCRPNVAVCLQHAKQLCDCPMKNVCLQYRYTLAEMQDMIHELPLSSESFPAPLSLYQFDYYSFLSSNSTKKPLVKAISFDSPSKNTKKKTNDAKFLSHAEVAALWVARVQKLLADIPSVAIINELLSQAKEFSWGGHDVDQVRDLELSLSTTKNWFDDIALCYNQIKSFSTLNDRVSYDRVKVLLGSKHLSIEENYSSEIRSVVEDAELLKSRVEPILNGEITPNFEDLNSLYNEILSFPLRLSEIDQLKSLIESTKNWSEKVQHILDEKLFPNSKNVNYKSLTLDHLLQLKSKGENLRVRLKEHEVLNSIILNSENFKRKIQQLLNSVPDLLEVELAFREGNNIPVTFDELSVLKSRYTMAQEWVSQVHAIMQPCIQLRSHKKHKTSDVQSLLDQASLLLIKVPDFENLKVELRKRLWNDLASDALENMTSLNRLHELLNEAISLGIHSTSYIQISSLIDKVQSMNEQYQNAIKQKSNYSVFSHLLKDVSSIRIDIPFKIDLVKMLSDCDTWKKNSSPILDIISMNSIREKDEPSHNFPTFQHLINLFDEYNRLHIGLKEAEKLITYVNLIREWQVRAKESLSRPISLTNLDDSDLNAYVLEINQLLQQGQNFRVQDIPEIPSLHHFLKIAEWESKALTLISSKPTLQEVENAIGEVELNSLPVNEVKFVKLKENAELVRSWRILSSSIIHPSTKCSVEHLEEIINRGKDLPLNVSHELSEVENILHSYRNLEARIDEFLCGGSELSWRCLYNLYKQTKQSMIQSFYFSKLESSLKDISKYYHHCFSSISKSNICDSNISDHMVHKNDFYSMGRLEDSNDKDDFDVNKIIMDGTSENNNIGNLDPNDSRDMDSGFFSETFTFESNLCGMLSKIRTCLEKQITTLEKVKIGVFTKCACDKLHGNKLSFLYCTNCRDRFHRLCMSRFIEPLNKKIKSSFLCPFCISISSKSMEPIEAFYCKKLFSSRPKITALQNLIDFKFDSPLKLKSSRLIHEICELSKKWRTVFLQVASDLSESGEGLTKGKVIENVKENDGENQNVEQREAFQKIDCKEGCFEERGIVKQDKKLLSLCKILFSSEIDLEVNVELKRCFLAYFWRKDVNRILSNSRSSFPNSQPAPLTPHSPPLSFIPPDPLNNRVKPPLSVIDDLFQRGEANSISQDDLDMTTLASMKRKAYDWINRAKNTMANGDCFLDEKLSLLEEANNLEVEVDGETKMELQEFCNTYKCKSCDNYPSYLFPIYSCTNCSKFFHLQCASPQGTCSISIMSTQTNCPNQENEGEKQNCDALENLTWKKKPRSGNKSRSGFKNYQGSRQPLSLLDVNQPNEGLKPAKEHEADFPTSNMMKPSSSINVGTSFSKANVRLNPFLPHEMFPSAHNDPMNNMKFLEGESMAVNHGSKLVLFSPFSNICDKCARENQISELPRSRKERSMRQLLLENEEEFNGPKFKRAKNSEHSKYHEYKNQSNDENWNEMEYDAQSDSLRFSYFPSIVPRKRRSNLSTPFPSLSHISQKRKRSSSRRVKRIALHKMYSTSSPLPIPSECEKREEATKIFQPDRQVKEEEKDEPSWNSEHNLSDPNPNLKIMGGYQMPLKDTKSWNEEESENKRFCSSGRPCRQTAGYHRGYDAFFLLPRS